jgi:predicted nucleotidyltransferase
VNKKEIATDFAKSLNYPEIKKIILFGSVARDEDNHDSDIDILIITTDREKISHNVYKKVSDIFLDLEEYVSAKIITIDDYEEVKNTHFISTVEKEGIILGGL